MAGADATTQGGADDARFAVAIAQLAAKPVIQSAAQQLRIARAELSRPATKAIQKWILEQKCIPGGALKKGLAYVAARWTGLTRFLDDPRIPLDNNIAEAGFVGLALGRRNYVGCRSERGMVVATTFYTVFESARVCGASPDEYIRYAAEALLDGRVPLLPHEWVAEARRASDAPS